MSRFIRQSIKQNPEASYLYQPVLIMSKVQDALFIQRALTVSVRRTLELHTSILVVLLLHLLAIVLVNLDLSSLLFPASLGLLLRDDNLVTVIVGHSSSSRLALTTLLCGAGLGFSRLAFLRHVSVNVCTRENAQSYFRRCHNRVDVLTGSLACLLDFLLLFVQHDLACLDGTAFRQSEFRPRDCTSFGDDLEEEAGL
jgi:hypothetical protein